MKNEQVFKSRRQLANVVQSNHRKAHVPPIKLKSVSPFHQSTKSPLTFSTNHNTLKQIPPAEKIFNRLSNQNEVFIMKVTIESGTVCVLNDSCTNDTGHGQSIVNEKEDPIRPTVPSSSVATNLESSISN